MKPPKPSHYATALALMQQVNDHLTYAAALALTRQVDDHLTVSTSSGHARHTSSHHYWTKSGELLENLDQVVNAILDNNLLTGEDL